MIPPIEDSNGGTVKQVIFVAATLLLFGSSAKSQSLGTSREDLGLSAIGFEGSLCVGGYRAPRQEEGASAGRYYSIGTKFTHKPSQLSFETGVTYIQDFYPLDSSVSNDSFGNPSFSVKKSWDEDRSNRPQFFNSVSIGLASTLPGNSSARDRTFQRSIAAFVNMNKKIMSVSWSQSLSYSRGFFENETLENSANVFKIAQDLRYQITEKFSFGPIVQVLHSAPTFGGSRTKVLWVANSQYQVSKDFAIDLGYGPWINFVRNDPQSDQLGIYDQMASTVYAEANVTF